MSLRFTNQQFTSMRQERIAKALLETLDTAPGITARQDANIREVFAVDGQGNATSFGFDEFGFVGSQTTPLKRRFVFRNDHHGRLKEFRLPSGASTQFNYDSIHRVSQILRRNRKVCQFQYGDFQHLTKINYYDKTSRKIDYLDAERPLKTTNRCREIEKFAYDSDGLLESIVDGNGNETRFRYDNWTRPSKVVFPGGSTEGYSYNESGQLNQIRVNDLVIATTTVDREGRLLEANYKDGTFKRFEYDADGRVILAENESGKVTFSYNEVGQILSENQNGETVTSRYTDTGLLNEITFPCGQCVGYDSDPDARLSNIRLWNEQSASISWLPDDAGYDTRLPNGVLQRTLLNDFGFVVGIDLLRSTSGNSLAQLQITYDGEDRVSQFHDSRYSRKSFDYDPENHLTAVHRTVGDGESFEYDANRNRVLENGTKCEVNRENQLIGCPSGSINYDDRGNVVLLTTSVGPVQLEYNLQNQLICSRSSSGIVEYTYDAFGRRVTKTLGDTITKFLYDGNRLIQETTISPDGSRSTRKYCYIPNSMIPFAMEDSSGQTFFFHTDHLGTPIRLTDSSGVIAWSADYAAYGEASVTESTVENTLRLPGQYFDRETGLHYNGARYYSPRLGRFLSQDPLKFITGMNFYCYSGNDPINNADPSGLWGWPSWKSVVSAVAAVAVGVVVAVTLPVSAPIAILAAGAAAGAVGFGLNEALNQESFCGLCIAKEMLRGAGIGALAAAPFALLPAAAGVGAFAGVGAVSGAIGYLGDVATSDAPFSWSGLATSMGIGAVTAGLGRYLAPKIGNWWKGRKAPSNQPPAKGLETRGYRPKPGERSVTREQWKEQYRAQRAERNARNVDRPDVGHPTRGGHMHADHGHQTTMGQQQTRVETGATPSGHTSNTSRASKFNTAADELEAVGRARSALKNAPKYKTNPDGSTSPNVETVVVGKGDGTSYGSGIVRQKYPPGHPQADQSIPAPPGGVKPTQPTGPLPNARVTMEYNPATGQWEPITGFPTNQATTH